MAKNKETAIIPVFEANRIFGNIGELVAVNQMLLCELETLSEQSFGFIVSNIGDVMYQNLRNFSCYEEFIGDFEQAKSLYNRMLKNKAFREFLEVSTCLPAHTTLYHRARQLRTAGTDDGATPADTPVPDADEQHDQAHA